MQTSIKTIAIKPALIAALGLVMLGVLAQPAFASTTNLEHMSFTELRVGELNAQDREDGYWFFISGARASLEIKAQSRNGNTIGSMGVWSARKQAWLQSASATSTVQTFSGEVNSGWHYVRLSNFNNSTTTYRLTISTKDLSPYADAGNTWGTATVLTGVGVNGRSWHDRVGLGDTTDIYRFDIPFGTNFVSIHAFETWSGGANINLYDANKNLLQAATANGTNNALIERSLPGGTYFIRVTEAGNQALRGTGYHLWVRSEQTPPDTAGNINGTPRHLGTARVGLNLTVSEFVKTRIDPMDAFSFDVPAISGNTAQLVNITLSGQTGNANLYLLNPAKNIINNSTSQTSNESISRWLAPGRYYVMVLESGVGETPYTLTVRNQGAPATVIDRGSNIRQTVTILGSATSTGITFTDNIGGTDTVDWWRIYVPYPNVFTQNAVVGYVMQVTGLPAGAVVQMFPSASSSPTASVPAVNGSAQFTIPVSPGAYDFSVTVPAGSAATTYTLSACSYSTYLGCTLP